jgi:hypothetical protein
MLLALVNLNELIVIILSIRWEEDDEEEANLFRKLMACQYPHLGI